VATTTVFITPSSHFKFVDGNFEIAGYSLSTNGHRVSIDGTTKKNDKRFSGGKQHTTIIIILII
jgi:hypothetical protein